MFIKDYKHITVPIKHCHVESIQLEAQKDDKSVRQWLRHAIEEKLALLGYIDEPK